jgi:GntR family transcriptional regulator
MSRTVPLPLYYRIKQDLLAAIEAGQLQPGARMPSERELTERYGVSRMTVRHAIGHLEQEGLVRRVQGKGSFVAPPKVEQTLVGLTSFTEEMKRRGLTPSSQVLGIELIKSERVAEQLYLPAEAPLYAVERLRLAGGEPMEHERLYLPARLVPGLPERDLTGSLYELLRRQYGIRLQKALQTLEAVLADEAEAALLAVPVGSPLLAITRVAYATNGEAVEYSRALYRGDRYKFTVSLSRKEDGSL